MNWYIEVLKKYAVFNGRASRSEYWYFALFNVIILLFWFILWKATGYIIFGIIYLLYNMAVLIPVIAVNVRRLHDTNHSGWWMLLDFIPIIGPIILLVFVIKDSDAGTNQYGQNPKTPSPKNSLQ
jgi:uncharacterized membrane protein YhaH (DUF805 family)